MHLKEYAIRHYGPLSDSGVIKPGLFNLIYGANEDGKTMTIDALLKLLFSSKGLRDFKGLNRVTENPEGYLIIGDKAGSTYKLPEEGGLEDLFPISIAEFRNIFLIRDSDLIIKGESDFYRNLTSRLTGMRSAEIKAIRGRINDLAQITSGGDFVNTVPLKLKDKIKKAEALLVRIRSILKELQDEGFNQFEEELAYLESQFEEKRNLLNLYRAAARRDRYLKGKDALKSLHSSSQLLQALERYSSEEYEEWQRLELRLEQLIPDLDHLETSSLQNGEDLKVETAKMQKQQIVNQSAESLKREALERVEPLLVEYEQISTAADGHRETINNRFYKLIFTGALIATLIILIGLLITPTIWSALLLSLFLGGLIILGRQVMISIQLDKKSLEKETALYAEAQRIGFTAENIENLRGELGRVRREAELEAATLAALVKAIERHQDIANRLQEDMTNKKNMIAELEKAKNSIIAKSGAASLHEYGSKLAAKRDLQRDLEKAESVLGSHFPGNNEVETGKADLAFWESELEKLAERSDLDSELQYDQTIADQLRAAIQSLEEKKKQLADQLYERSEQLRDLEKEINDLPLSAQDLTIPCQTMVDLEAAEQAIDLWLNGLQQNRENAFLTNDLFSALEAEEEAKVTTLFGPTSPVSELYSRITAGRYHSVSFDSLNNIIKVTTADQTELEAEQLSGGAYDQLYIAIRLALAEKLLDGEKGFFILDDPFIKADSSRLEALFNLLFQINKAGWQIFYFSCKGEVKALLAEKIKEGSVIELAI